MLALQMEMVLVLIQSYYIIILEVAMITIGSTEIFINFNGPMAPLNLKGMAEGMSMDAGFC
jgi:hypothetical protein